ncbi:ComF family protein [Cerasicoccus maritimus]|uniref:ComF family protein n=1 Tax=Cerasicoccus maritimus TaxID=490089 RepID=UPI0028525742|nr:ComF family protein [Cerasicoccus maritimus]
MTRLYRQFQTWGRNALDLIYPRECLVTGEPVENNSPCRYLSIPALERIYFIHEPHCGTCGAPFFGELIALRDCPHCRELNPAYANGRSLFFLRDTGREFIHELKYRNGQRLVPDLSPILRRAPRYLEFLAGSILVPIPLHPVRERERGYNQSLLIALQLGEISGCPVQDILERVKFTETQTRLDRSQRQANMRDAFAVKKGVNLSPDQRLVLVDDVFTTGATLNSAAKILLKAGVQQIDVATLGHG